jgi:ABC-type dipeptide/oligopeptide/nickel transport system permease subunit
MVSAVGSSVVMLIYILAPLSNDVILPIGFVLGFINLMMFSPMGSFMTELFPSSVRGVAQGFCYNAGRGIGAVFPALVGVMSAAFGLAIAIAVLSFPGAARVVRGETLSLRERDFVTAGRVLGASPQRILFRHILPNAMAPIIVIASLRIGGAILIETGLSFLGLGVQPPTASWGSMVNEGSRFLERAPWISMTSGGAIFLAVLGANLMGDAIRDTLDPRLRNE